MAMLRRTVVFFIRAILFLPLLMVFATLAIFSRAIRRPIDIGLGPEPLINNVYHKKALTAFGYSAETFVSHLYFITSDFDICVTWRYCLSSLYLAAMALLRYRALYIYFTGGPLAWTPLRRVEPWIYKLAGIKILVMPYGGDVQDMLHCANLSFKHAMNKDYPTYVQQPERVAKQIARWSQHADHIVSGCDWVYYTPRWDSLCLAHFSIDTNDITPLDSNSKLKSKDSPIVILHAPNHKEIKGSRFFIRAVEELQAEGYNVELRLVQRMPNAELRNLIREADIIADQLVIGWYAMFALEGMSAGKPVLCYLDKNLCDLYEFAGLIEPGEIPLVNCRHDTVKEALLRLLNDPALVSHIGKASRDYVIKHHSLEAIGSLFDRANQNMGLVPSEQGRGS